MGSMLELSINSASLLLKGILPHHQLPNLLDVTLDSSKVKLGKEVAKFVQMASHLTMVQSTAFQCQEDSE